ncbi:MAG: MBL fold metallo-hydrolase [Anaerolineae bacterium]|nr:MBL fold metallo-hydrolase [Anaerolineae bacterium]
MKLVMLGSGGFVPTEQAQTACYFLPEYNILLDGGTGLYRIHNYMQQARALDVYLSHTHGDHTTGLHYLFGSYFKKLANDATDRPVDISFIEDHSRQANQLLNSTRIHVTERMLANLKDQYPWPLDWRILESVEALPGGGTLRYFAFDPAREEVGFRLEWPGHSLAYITDTIASPQATYIDQIAGVDLLLHDCNLTDEKAQLCQTINHSSTSAVAQVAARAGVKRLCLIHFNPMGWDVADDLPAARKIFPVTEIGHDGMEIEF